MTETKKICKNCGKPAPLENKFCIKCGTKFSDDTPTTTQPVTYGESGNTIKDEEKLGCACGGGLASAATTEKKPTEPTISQKTEPTEPTISQKTEPTEPTISQKTEPTEPTISQPTEHSGAKLPKLSDLLLELKKHKKKVIIGATALLLVVCLLITGFCQPGFFLKKDKDNPPTTGVSTITISEKDKKVKPESKTVSHEVTRVELNSGVIVDFGKGNLQADEKLDVRKIGKKSDKNYQAEIYDFDMGETDRFPFLVEITLPYDSAWGDDVFVQYYNEKTKQWEAIWYDTDGKGTVTFQTDHFSTYAVFKKYVEQGGEKPENGGSLFIPLSKTLAMDTYCRLDIAALARYVRVTGLVDIGTITPGNRDTIGIESALNILNNTGSFGTSSLDFYDFIDGANNFGNLTKVLNYVGNSMTIAKMLMQATRTGKIGKTIYDHSVDLTAMALNIAANATTGLTATLCNATAFALLVYGTIDSMMSYVDLLGAENKTEYAYRFFTTNYLTYILNENRIGIKYGAGEYQKVNQLWQASEVSLRTAQPFGNPDYTQWMMTLESIFQKNQNDPNKIVPAIDSFLDAYCKMFWQIEDSNNKIYNDFLNETRAGSLSLNNLIDVYEKPSEEERATYSARLKNDLIKWLSPMLEEYSKKAYNATLNLLLQNALELERELNTDVSFTLVEKAPYEAKEYFESDVAMKPFNAPKNLEKVRIRQFKLDKELWEFTKKNKYTVSCSRYVYMLSGMPKFIDFYYTGEKEPTTITMRVSFPKTYIELSDEEFPTLAEIIGDYDDGKTTLGGEYIKEIYKKILEGLASITGGEATSVDGSAITPKPEAAPFTLVKTSANGGEFHKKVTSTKQGDALDGTFTYDEKTGELKLTIIKTDEDVGDVRLTGTLRCTYSNNNKKVQISGTISGIVVEDLDLTITITGSKDINA